jgi:hypothetical protein
VFASFEDKDASPKDTQATVTTGKKLPSSGKSDGTSSEKEGWYSEIKTTENIELKKLIPSPTLKGSDGKSKKIDPEKQKVINKLEGVVGKDVSKQKGNDFDKLSSLSVDDEGEVKKEIELKKYPKTKSSSNKGSSLSPKSKKAKTSAKASKIKKTAGNKGKKSSKK